MSHRGINQSSILIEKYRGNPFKLSIAAATIKSLFAGDVHKFIAHNTIVYGDIWVLISQQLNRLTKLEKTIMYWLTINQEVTTLSELAEDIFPPVSLHLLIAAIESLKRRSLIEIKHDGFTLQPAIMEYITILIIEKAEQEIITKNIIWLKQ